MCVHTCVLILTEPELKRMRVELPSNKSTSVSELAKKSLDKRHFFELPIYCHWFAIYYPTPSNHSQLGTHRSPSNHILPRPTLDSTAILPHPTLSYPILPTQSYPSYPTLDSSTILPCPTTSYTVLPYPTPTYTVIYCNLLPSYHILPRPTMAVDYSRLQCRLG